MVVIRTEPIAELDRHGETSIAFEVTTVLDIELVEEGLGGLRFRERAVEEPWTKEYDSAADGPAIWAARFDVANWGLLGAYDDERRIGGAVIAFDTPDVHLLRGRRDLAVVWDLRVAPAARRCGAGAALFGAAETWARRRGCTALEVETQQINVTACRFYARMGCTLAAVDRVAYADEPDETQLIWRRRLDASPGPAAGVMPR